MNKKAQIALFLIAGIVLFIIFVFLSAIKQQSNTTNGLNSNQNNPIEIQAQFHTESKLTGYIDSCLKQTTEQAILSNGLHGGYFNLPKESTSDLQENIPYYSQNNNVLNNNPQKINFLYPSDEILLKQISSYVDSLLPICLNNFIQFKEQGYLIKINQQMPSTTNAIFSADGLIIKTNLPITITKESTKESAQIQLANFMVELPAKDLHTNFKLAKIIAETMEQKEICYTCFSKIAEQNNISVNIIHLQNNVYLFELINTDYKINDEQYKLRFGVKYE